MTPLDPARSWPLDPTNGVWGQGPSGSRAEPWSLLRIVAGTWRGRTLRAPPGADTRPTADRARQTLFDMLAHAPWAPSRDVRVLDGFAGTGALGLEALSRGATHATFIENDRAALAALRANVAALGAPATIHAADILRPPRAPAPAGLVLLDPPYGRNLAAAAIPALAAAGWFGPDTILVVETAADEPPPPNAGSLLAERRVGAARLFVTSPHREPPRA